MRWAIVAALVCGCAASASRRDAREADLEAPDDKVVHRLALDLGADRGLSGIAVDGDGVTWVITERDPVLVALDEDGVRRRVPVRGIPSHLDVESLAWLGGRRFAVGTELDVPPTGPATATAPIFVIEIHGDGARVVGRIPLPPALDASRVGRGLEGLCASRGRLVAGVEAVESRGDRRWTRIGVLDLTTGRWTVHDLRLTSATGKISSLACRDRRGALEVLAVERHFGVTRLLRFTVPARGAMIEPVIDGDLTAFANRTGLNFEGAEWGDDGTIVLVVDNHYKQVTGPNELVLWRLYPDD